MNAFLKSLKSLDDEQLVTMSDAIDLELEHRMECYDDLPDSARRRAVERGGSYRRKNGSSAPPVALTGLRDPVRKRHAA